jgi:hypothetical protein
MKNESIKVGNTTYSIANGSCSLNDLSGYTAKVAIIIGSNDIQQMHKNLSENTTVIKYDVDGVEQWRQNNLIYTGQMSLNSSFPIGIEQVEETDEEGNPKYINKEIMGEVVIVEYRTPSLQDEIKSQKDLVTNLNVQLSQLSAVTGVGIEKNKTGKLTIEELKELKKAEINVACGQIVSRGLTVEMSTGFEHFSLSQSDQLNLFGLQAQLASGVEQIVYHSDGQPCRYYPSADIAQLIEKAMFHVSYHVTYGNSLKLWIESLKTEEEIQGIFYGIDIPVEYQSEVLNTYLAQIASLSEIGGK